MSTLLGVLSYYTGSNVLLLLISSNGLFVSLFYNGFLVFSDAEALPPSS